MTPGPTPGLPLTDDDTREALHRFVHNGWACEYGDLDKCPRQREIEAHIERFRADAYQQGRTDLAAVVEALLRTAYRPTPDSATAQVNAAALDRLRAAIGADSTPRPVLDVAPCGCHFPKIAGCDHDEPADSTPSEDQP